jgi:hypothetical protein
MKLSRRVVLAMCLLISTTHQVAAGEPRVIRRVPVYSEPGRFAGWPANHGIWSWGDEILVGFSRGFDKDNGTDYHIDADRPEDFPLARSRDGGVTWLLEEPKPARALVGTRGMRHAAMPRGIPDERPVPLVDPIDFSHRDFALVIHMEHHQSGRSCFYHSYDRGMSWRGPFLLPLFGQRAVMGRTDYLVEGRDRCLLFLTATKSDGTEGRPFSARTIDGGSSWQFLGFIGPEPTGYAVMPSTARLSASELVTAVRCRDFPRRWIDVFRSRDDGQIWSYLATPAPDIGTGNPPALVRLKDGRLCLTYGYRAEPFAIHARLSADDGATWTHPFILRGNGGSQDIGYPRSIVRPDGMVVTVYAFHDRSNPTRGIEAAIWDPGTR